MKYCPAEITRTKQEFLKSFGPENSLKGYFFSYKLVLWHAFFLHMDDERKAPFTSVVQEFSSFYLCRKQLGLSPEINPRAEINFMNFDNLHAIWALIRKNPFNALSGNQTGVALLEKQLKSGKEYFAIPSNFSDVLSKNDLEILQILVNNKLELYFEKRSAPRA